MCEWLDIVKMDIFSKGGIGCDVEGQWGFWVLEDDSAFE